MVREGGSDDLRTMRTGNAYVHEFPRLGCWASIAMLRFSVFRRGEATPGEDDMLHKPMYITVRE